MINIYGGRWEPLNRNGEHIVYGNNIQYEDIVCRINISTFDGDVLNDLALTMEEFWELFDGFSPVNMLINRTDSSIKLDCSALENISLAILSDH